MSATFQPRSCNAPLPLGNEIGGVPSVEVPPDGVPSVEVPSVAGESGRGGIPESKANGTQKTPLKLVSGVDNNTVRKVQIAHSLQAYIVPFDTGRILSPLRWDSTSAISIGQHGSLPVIKKNL